MSIADRINEIAADAKHQIDAAVKAALASEFTVDSRVKITGPVFNGSRAYIGSFGDVFSVPDADGDLRVRLDAGNSAYFPPSSLELADAAAPAPTPEPLKRGDRVRLTGESEWGYPGHGKEATVVDPSYFGRQVLVTVDGDDDGGDRIDAADKVTLIPAPTLPPAAFPLDLAAKYGDRAVRLKVSLGGDLRLEVANNHGSDTSYHFAFLTAEHARTLAAALLAGADRIS